MHCLLYFVTIQDHHKSFAWVCIIDMHLYVIGFALGAGTWESFLGLFDKTMIGCLPFGNLKKQIIHETIATFIINIFT